MLAAIKNLKEQRAKLVDAARAALNRDPNSPQFDAMMADEAKLTRRIAGLERAAKLNTSGELVVGPVEADTAIFDRFIRHGVHALDSEERSVLARRHKSFTGPRAALSTGSGTAGGYTVPTGFYARLEAAILGYGGIFDACRFIDTESGAAMPFPTGNDTAQKGVRVAENGDAFSGGTDPSFGQVNFTPYLYSSRGVLVPISLLQDAAFDIEAELAEWLGTRIARIQAEEFVTGTGVDEPNGIVTAATVGHTTAEEQVDSLLYDDLVDLEHSVDREYRRKGSWLMSDDTLKVIKKLKAADSDLPAWVPGIAAGEPDTILGHPYVIDDNVPAIEAGSTPLLFGDLRKYVVRRVVNAQLVRFGEKYMDRLQVGFLAYHRADGDLVDAGTHPVKKLQMAAV